MADVSGTVSIILEFVDLAVEGRIGALSPKDKSRMSALDQTLRELIDGALSKSTLSDGALNVPTTVDVSAKTLPASQPAIVHLLAGGMRRGQIENFDPLRGILDFLPEPSGGAESVLLKDVMAIFFGLARGSEPIPSHGRRVCVRLMNDRLVEGLSEDYQEGADSLTVVPELRRGHIDRIWIPARGVKDIRLS